MNKIQKPKRIMKFKDSTIELYDGPPTDPRPCPANGSPIEDCVEWFKAAMQWGMWERLIRPEVLSRINHGAEEPKHLPRADYAWYPVRRAWLESDKALKRRRNRAPTNKGRKAQGEKK